MKLFQGISPLRLASAAVAIVLSSLVTGCASMSSPSGPISRASMVELDRYMGPWFVIAAIPLPIEEGAFDSVESYVRNPDGSVATVFQFRKGGFNGKLQVKPIVSEVVPGTANAEWRVQTLWPLKQQYVISHIETDYSSVIVGRDARDHVWILSRTPTLSADRLEAYRRVIANDGYDLQKLVMFPQDGRRPLP